ncbi:FAD-binding oxidoreductase [Saccharopolyspora sp. ASAGF58]|uniref:NAD(P)/FAD-dependent oxidoreductase n=1 Tax=Saccharopolyspora sp. ASAGF58 TaxID=2719023 RepID=UPI00143FCA87|nr:FAD-binding oxidoreductase [Saccharopolyspora sp. ASAGF58]QIZ34499.1 FAD-binding oxidoreductase [Saccharopolyspora sp. ASAGF58]
MAEHKRELDIAVIGAGVLGLSTTDALLRRGADVKCFDGRRPGAGQSGGLSRTFRHRHDDPHIVDLAVRGLAGYREWERRSGVEMVGTEGCAYLGTTADDTLGLKAHQVPHHYVPEADREQVFGALGPIGGPLLVDPTAGALRVNHVIETLTGWVGGHIVANDIHSLLVLDNGKVEFQTADAIYHARHVVLCAGVDTPRLAARLGWDIPLDCALHARPHYRIREELRGAPTPCWVDKSGEFGEMVYGSVIPYTDQYVLGLIGDGVDVPFDARGALTGEEGMEDHVRRVTGYVERALPGLIPEPVGVRVCIMSKLPAGSDALRAWHAPGVTAIAGHNLFKFAPELGELLADSAVDDGLPADLELAGARALGAA